MPTWWYYDIDNSFWRVCVYAVCRVRVAIIRERMRASEAGIPESRSADRTP